MDEYAGRVLAGRYRLPRPPANEFELVESRAFDTYSGQEVLVRQVPLPEIVAAEADGDKWDEGFGSADGDAVSGGALAQCALRAARAAAAIPDHPSLVQVFDVLVEDGGLWVVSELVGARPVAALTADRPLTPYRAAEVAADVLSGLRALHAHGWAHRNITPHTVLVCDDGRALLDGLATGAAQEALCGYDPVPAGFTDPGGGQDEPEHDGWHGPDPALAVERARQARMAVVGPVAERWAPEQAGEAPDDGRLAPPAGPPADLWALGALLFRCVQGHPPYPEESTAELVRLVGAEPPAPAGECGPLRPVVEALLRRDPAERPGPQELRERLRALVRSAPEPDLGNGTVQVPTGPADPHKLPVVRRRGELVRLRRRRAARPARTAEEPAAVVVHGRHARAKPARSRSPRRLGLALVGLIFLLLAGVVAYAMVFMPHTAAGTDHSMPAQVSTGGTGGGPAPSASTSGAGDQPSPTDLATAPSLGSDFALREDPAGFTIAVHNGWTRAVQGPQVVYSSGGGLFRLIVVHGRDSAASAGADPLDYELTREPELAPFRASTWSSSAGVHALETDGGHAAVGEFTYRDPSTGARVYARNMALLRGGRYDVVLAVGPLDERTAVSDCFARAVATYRPGD